MHVKNMKLYAWTDEVRELTRQNKNWRAQLGASYEMNGSRGENEQIYIDISLISCGPETRTLKTKSRLTTYRLDADNEARHW